MRELMVIIDFMRFCNDREGYYWTNLQEDIEGINYLYNMLFDDDEKKRFLENRLDKEDLEDTRVKDFIELLESY